MRYLLLVFLYTFSFSISAQPEVWLLSGKDCNICELFEGVSQQRGYQESVVVKGIEYPIKRIDKANMPAFLVAALGDEVVNDKYWPVQLNVAVVDGQSLLYQGNIAQSADFSQAFIKSDYMQPKSKATLEQLHQFGFNYPDFFKQQFNLEYFVNVALHKVTPHKDNALALTLSDFPPARTSSVSLWGSAMQPARNGLFISTRIKQLAERFNEEVPYIVFAHGSDSQALDTLTLNQEDYRFVKAEVKSDFAADVKGIEQWLSSVKNNQAERHLLIQVGHSGPIGAPVWGHALPINQALLKQTIAATGKNTVMVSGACHSGLFAQAASCGFYAAHPDAIATGCQTSLSAIEASDDYLKFFFADNSSRLAQTELDPRDVNQDNQVTFNEAHWFASAQLEDHNLSYTDTDFFVDQYFAQHPAALPNALTLLQITELAKQLSTEEQAALKVMSTGLTPKTEIELKGYVKQHQAAIAALQGKTELSSAKRNALIDLAYPLNLVILARRALYSSLNTSIDEQLQSCEHQPIEAFIRAD